MACEAGFESNLWDNASADAYPHTKLYRMHPLYQGAHCSCAGIVVFCHSMLVLSLMDRDPPLSTHVKDATECHHLDPQFFLIVERNREGVYQKGKRLINHHRVLAGASWCYLVLHASFQVLCIQDSVYANLSISVVVHDCDSLTICCAVHAALPSMFLSCITLVTCSFLGQVF